MKLHVLLSVIAFTYGDKLDRTYLPPEAHNAGGTSNILQTPVPNQIIVTESPDVQRSTIAQVVTEVPIYQRPTVANIVTEIPVHQRPIAHDTVTEIPTYQRPIAHDTVTEIPTYQRPVTEGVVNDIPIYQGPVDSNVISAFRRPLYYIANTGAYQRPGNIIIDQRHGNIVEAERRPEEEVVEIGNRGNVYLQRPITVENQEVTHSHPQVQVIEQRPERPQAHLERHAAILRQDFKYDGDSYAYVYETENGIYGEQNGVATHGVAAQGAFSYVGDDGVQYSVRYTADENGFQPHGDHLPTPPPVPEEILKSLEQNARDEAAGIYDDGSYSEEKYGEVVRNKELGIINIVENHPNVLPQPVISDHIENEEKVVIIPNPSLKAKFQSPGFRNPNNFIEQVNNLRPVVRQEVLEDTLQKGYLPPLDQKILEDRTSPKIIRPVFGNRPRKPSFSAKKGYKY